MMEKKANEKRSEREKKAWTLAKEIHGKETRRSGKPYIEHIEETVELVKEIEEPANEHIVISAILHDVLENCKKEQVLELVNRIVEMFGADVLTSVLKLTHMEKMTYDEYIDRVMTDSTARAVKLADMLQNLTDAPTEHQKTKYKRAFTKLLRAHLCSMGE